MNYINAPICEGVAGIECWDALETGSQDYIEVHTEIRDKLGIASNHTCIQCDDMANDWAWQHGNNPYKIYNYQPMCRSCHTLYDDTDKRRSKIGNSMIGNLNCLGYKHTDKARYNMGIARIGNTNSQGEKCWNSVLSEIQVLEIRAKWATGKYLQRDIGDMYGVSTMTISQIVNRKTWRHI